MKAIIFLSFIALAPALNQLETQQADLKATLGQLFWWALVLVTAGAALGLIIVTIRIVREMRAMRARRRARIADSRIRDRRW